MRRVLQIIVIGLVLLTALSQLGAPAAAMVHARAMEAHDMADCIACPESHHKGQPAQDMSCPHAQMLSAALPVLPGVAPAQTDMAMNLRPLESPQPLAHEPQLDLPPPRL
ncbi:hypothetical protein [Pseudothioclava arenosa]|uniref:Uncharacterized protein n=1 Tax=Pseudothioclava arenosa TaxID=1795308 RepID=A0A2A4CR02_9RHOB|nr:hypothetical protein [Pseudothioclava arenosa]PCD76718.1 hypothetical protein CLN94_06295 [Pseudothioclava arenosa]